MDGYQKNILVSVFFDIHKFGESGKIVFENLYLGEMYVKEITAPEGYLLDETEYDVTLSYEGQEVAVVTAAKMVTEQVLSI